MERKKISVLIARNDKFLLSVETKETTQSTALGRLRVWRNTSLVLVRGVTSSTAPVAAPVTAPRRESSAPETSSSTAGPSSSTAAAHTGNVGALGRDFDVASLEDTLVQHEGLGNQAGLGKLDIGVAFGLSGKLVQENGNSIDGAAALEMRLDFLWRGRVIDVAHENASSVDRLFVIGEISGLLLQCGLHLTQFLSLLFHLCDSALHRLDLLLFTGRHLGFRLALLLRDAFWLVCVRHCA